MQLLVLQEIKIGICLTITLQLHECIGLTGKNVEKSSCNGIGESVMWMPMTTKDILKVIQSAGFQDFYEGKDFKDFIEGIDDELEYNEAQKKLLTSIGYIFNLRS